MAETIRPAASLCLIVVAALAAAAACIAAAGPSGGASVSLPKPITKGSKSLEETLAARRSVRRFAAAPLSIEQIGQLCWAAQGVSEPGRGLRTAPSAGALYPLELYVVTAAGVRHYVPAGHALAAHISGDVRPQLQQASWGQSCVGSAPAVFVIAAETARTARKYGDRAQRYVDMEVGHAGQNILLQAVAMDLAAVPVGAFQDEKVAAILKLPAGAAPLYLIPVGQPAK